MAQPAKVIAGTANATRLLACVADDVTREAVTHAAAQLGWPDATVRPGGIAAVAAALDPQRPPDLILVDLSTVEAPVAAAAELTASCGPATRIVALGAVNDVALFRELMALGVADYLVKPASSDLLADSLARAVRAEDAQAAPAHSARLFAFVGARGGVGTTTLALATAWLLAYEFKLRTAVVDLDLHFGNLALNLDLEPGRGLREALEHPERTDNLLLAAAMVRDGDKLPILAAEEPLDDVLGFAPEAASPLLTALRHDHDCIIADVPRSLDAVSRDVLAAADQIVVVTDLSLAALRDSLRLVDLARTLDAQGKPLIVANQVGGAHRGEIGRPEFERGLAGTLDLAVPFDAKAAIATARSGKAWPAAAGSSKATAELRRLAMRLSGREPKARRGLFGLFG